MVGFAKVNTFSGSLGETRPSCQPAHLYAQILGTKSPRVMPNHLWVSAVCHFLGSLHEDYHHLQLVGHELYFSPHASLPWLVPMLEYSEQGYGVPLSSELYSLKYH